MSAEDLLKLVASYGNARVWEATTASPAARGRARRDADRYLVEIRDAIRALDSRGGAQ